MQQSKFKDLFWKTGLFLSLKKLPRSMNKDNSTLLQVCVSMVPVHEVSRHIDCNLGDF